MSRVWLVHGPPGTGKTSNLARNCERAVEQHGASAVTIASLTKTAAHEIASRVTLPDHQVGTLHAHCYHALDRPELCETASELRDWNEKHPELAITRAPDQLEDTESGSDVDQAPGDRLHQQVMNHRARLTPVEHWTPEQASYYRAWCEWKDGRADFTDLIEQGVRQVAAAPGDPRVLLVDEAQDLSALELKLTAKWATAAETTVCSGDTDQAIFSWRGASPEALLGIERAGERVLEQSFRVPGAVHELASAWIHQIPDRAPVEYRPTSEPGRVELAAFSLRDTHDLLHSIEQLDGTVMVLTTCGYMLNPLLAALRANGVPFHNPYRCKQGAWNPLRGCRALTAFLRPDRRVWGDQARIWTWRDLQHWSDPLQAARAFDRGAKAAIDEHCRPDRFGESRSDQTVPLETLVALFGVTDLKHPAFRLDTGWWRDCLRASQTAKYAYPLAVLQHRGGRALLETPRLIAGTAHSVKGGEADHVILAPDLSRSGMDGWLAGGQLRSHVIRTGYVALTRARESLTVLRPLGWAQMPITTVAGREAATA